MADCIDYLWAAVILLQILVSYEKILWFQLRTSFLGFKPIYIWSNAFYVGGKWVKVQHTVIISEKSAPKCNKSSVAPLRDTDMCVCVRVWSEWLSKHKQAGDSSDSEGSRVEQKIGSTASSEVVSLAVNTVFQLLKAATSQHQVELPCVAFQLLVKWRGLTPKLLPPWT